MAVIQSFHGFFYFVQKTDCNLHYSMYLASIRGTMSFVGDYRSSLKTPWDGSATSFCGGLLWEPSVCGVGLGVAE